MLFFVLTVLVTHLGQNWRYPRHLIDLKLSHRSEIWQEQFLEFACGKDPTAESAMVLVARRVSFCSCPALVGGCPRAPSPKSQKVWPELPLQKKNKHVTFSKGPNQKGKWSSKQHFSGDMLVFGGVSFPQKARRFLATAEKGQGEDYPFCCVPQNHWVVVSSIFWFLPLGDDPIWLTIFEIGWNHQLDQENFLVLRMSIFFGCSICWSTVIFFQNGIHKEAYLRPFISPKMDLRYRNFERWDWIAKTLVFSGLWIREMNWSQNKVQYHPWWADRDFSVRGMKKEFGPAFATHICLNIFRLLLSLVWSINLSHNA